MLLQTIILLICCIDSYVLGGCPHECPCGGSPWDIIRTRNPDPVQNYGMHGQVYGPQDKIWLFGGVPENRSLVSSPEFWTGFAGANNVLRTFDPVSESFSVIQTNYSPPARSFFDMVRGTGRWRQHLFLFGGQGLNPTLTDSKDLGDLWSFNTQTLTWRNLTGSVNGTLPSPRTGAAVISMPNGKIYIYGGTKDWGVFLSDIYSFDPSTNAINLIVPSGTIPPPRGITNIASYEDDIYIAGGCCDSNSETGGYYKDVWRFDTYRNEWSEVEQDGLIYSNAYSASVAIGEWWFFQGGDFGACNTDLPMFETSFFNFNSQTWYRDIIPRYAGIGPLLKNGKASLVPSEDDSSPEVYVLGGYGSNRSDKTWCVQSDQQYKNLVYRYEILNFWFTLVEEIED